MMRFARAYRYLNRNIWRMIGGILLLNLINAAFFLIFNLYLRRLGYDDGTIGELVSLRHAGILLVALPLGIYIRKRRLKPFFIASGIATPLLSLVLVQAVTYGQSWWLNALMFGWGITFVVNKVCALPFILRHGRPRLQAEAFSLNYATNPLSQVISGVLISWLTWSVADELPSGTSLLAEAWVLMVISLVGLVSVVFFAFIRENPAPTFEQQGKRFKPWAEYDWHLVLQALAPAMFLAVGAGLTIPFINLYFNHVFGIDSATFGLIGAASGVLVVGSVLVGPSFLKRYGYSVAITVVQAIGVVLLFILASTQLISAWSGAVVVAVLAFLGRNPLMNMAAPMSHNRVMNYVGKRNHEWGVVCQWAAIQGDAK